MKQPKHAVTVVRDWHPLRRAVTAGAMSVMLASAMALPAFAATNVYYADSTGNAQEKTEAFTDEASGISWDGADAITLNNATLGYVDIAGNADIALTGENTVGNIWVEEGDLALNGDETVPAEEKPILNILTQNDESKEVTLQSATGYGYVEVEGNLIVKGLTLLFQNASNLIDVYGNLTIDNSKVAVADESSELYMDVEGTTDIVESVVDYGTEGGICSWDTLTIDNSDVTTRTPEDGPEGYIHSHTDIVLKNMANGTIDKETYSYPFVVTGDKDGVFLKAASEPGYYKGTAAADTKGMPKTSDPVNAGVFAGMAAAAAAVLGGMGLSRTRKHGKHEA